MRTDAESLSRKGEQGMTEDLRARAARLKHWLREHNIPGGCRILSQGDQCQCPLCDVDALLARAEAAEDYATRLQIDKDSLNAEAERYKELLDAAIEDYNREKQRAEAAEQQLQALQPRCVCHIEDGLVQEWVSKARAVAKSKGYLTQPGAASRVTFTVRCNYCGHLPCDCTEQPGAAGQE